MLGYADIQANETMSGMEEKDVVYPDFSFMREFGSEDQVSSTYCISVM